MESCNPMVNYMSEEVRKWLPPAGISTHENMPKSVQKNTLNLRISPVLYSHFSKLMVKSIALFVFVLVLRVSASYDVLFLAISNNDIQFLVVQSYSIRLLCWWSCMSSMSLWQSQFPRHFEEIPCQVPTIFPDISRNWRGEAWGIRSSP